MPHNETRDARAGNFTHLHVHSMYSLMDGLNSPGELLDAAVDQGQDMLSITDHGVGTGWREFQEEAAKRGVKPILGLEAYISPTDRFDRRPVKKRDDNTKLYNHIILLAQDKTGFKNLNRLSEAAWNEGFYMKPRIDKELLAEHAEGLIVLSGCMGGVIAAAIEREDYEEAERLTAWYKEHLGENFYMEVQAHNPEHLNTNLLALAEQYGIKPVATSDCHYARKEDAWIEDSMLILSTNPKAAKEVTYGGGKSKTDIFERLRYLYPDRPISFEGLNLYVQSEEELRDDFARAGITRSDIFENAGAIAESVGEYDFHKGLDLLPRPPKSQDPHKLLRQRTYEGLKARGLWTKPGYKERADEELEVIISKDFSVYFLILANLLKWCKTQGIRVGPGRGSGAGSLVNYSLYITNVDPIVHNLLFFRFLDPDREDFPDIDMDFQDDRRDEVKAYLLREYKNVASIATFGTYAGKSCIRDAARVFMVPLSDVNSALKGADFPTTVDFFVEWLKNPAGAAFAQKYPEVMELARYLHGRIKTQGMHAGGIVISAQPISDYAPMQTASHPRDKTQPRVQVVAMDMKRAADLGFVKYDLLGINALTVIDETLKMIKDKKGYEPDLEALDYADPHIYEMLSAGHTKGVFQCEQTPYTNLLVKMGGISNFGELAATNAVVRPGVANSSAGKAFLARRAGEEAVVYHHPEMEPFTNETYGVVIYQEQVMQTMTVLAGMTPKTANKVRTIIGKKLDVKLFEEYHEAFVDGAAPKIGKAAAEGLWHDFEAHAGYSFNKSHAVAYSVISYWTAWLKYYYPLEFMLCTLRSEKDKDKRLEYLMEAKRLGIRILMPHVNRSEAEFSAGLDEQGWHLRFGLENIKYISKMSASRLIEHRPYTSYKHLLEVVETKGSGLTKRTLQGLNAVGAAVFPDHPATGTERDNYYEYLAIPAFDVKELDPRIKAQIRPLSDYTDNEAFLIMGMVTNITRKPGWARIDIVDDSGKAGIFTDEHTPMEPGRIHVCLVANNRVMRHMTPEEIATNRGGFVKFLKAARLPDVPEDQFKVVSFQSRTTKAGQLMAHAVVSDNEKNLHPLVVFPRQYHRAFKQMAEGNVVALDIQEKDDGDWVLQQVM